MKGLIAACLAMVLGVTAAAAEDASNDLFRAGLKLLVSGDYRSACDVLGKGLSIGTNSEASGKASYYYGECLLKLGQPQQALTAFRRAVELSRDSEQGRSALAEEEKLAGVAAPGHPASTTPRSSSWAALAVGNEGMGTVAWAATREGAMELAKSVCARKSDTCMSVPAVTPDLMNVFAVTCCADPRSACVVAVDRNQDAARLRGLDVMKGQNFSHCLSQQALSALTGLNVSQN